MIEAPIDFHALAGAWDELPGVIEDPLLSHDWLSTAAVELHRDQRLQVATIWRGDQLAAAAPLVEVLRGRTVWLEFIGSRSLFEPCNVLFRDDGALNELVRFLVALRRPIAFRRLPLQSEFASTLRRASSGLVVRVNSSPCRHVDTLGPWDSYLIGRSRECAEGFPRKRAKLAAGGVVAFELLIPDPSTTELLLDEFITVEASSWKSATGSALSQNPHMEAFFRELLLRFSARGQARFFFLRCGRRAVAAQFSLHYASRIWELKTGFDANWRAASPGRLLLFEMLRDTFSSGQRSYEFLGSGDGQQADWSTGERRLQTLVLYPYSFRGLVALAGDFGHALARNTERVLACLRRRCAAQRQ